METPVLKSLFNKAADPQVFSCGYCEIFKNTNFEEHLRTAASVYSEDLLKYKKCVTKTMLPESF